MPLPALAAPHWAAAAEGELRLPHCRACGHVWFPPARHCPKCLSADVEWQTVSGRGRVTGWCQFHRPYFPALDLALPYYVILVELDEGPQLYSNLTDAKAVPQIGQRVEAVYVDAAPGQALVRFRITEQGS